MSRSPSPSPLGTYDNTPNNASSESVNFDEKGSELAAEPSSGSESLRDNLREQALAERAMKRAVKTAIKREAAESRKEEGNTFFNAGDYYNASLCYLDAIGLNGPKPTYLANLAATYLKLGFSEEAEQAAHQALTQDPKNIKARYRRGIARKEQGLLMAAVHDFETVLHEDPSLADVEKELSEVRALWKLGEGVENVLADSDYDLPRPEDDKLEIASFSDSSDCNHRGNGIPCRFYNHEGCTRGGQCTFSHAPDEKSVRDDLGKNVCIYYLLGKCKFGDIKCIYSHSKYCLPKQGWWNDEEQTAKVKAVVEAAEQQAKEQRALVNLMSKLEAKSRKRNGAGAKGRRHANPADSTTGGASSKGGKNRRGSARRYQSEQEMEERLANNGFTDYELNDLLSQGVKPWDDDAWDVLHALSY